MGIVYFIDLLGSEQLSSTPFLYFFTLKRKRESNKAEEKGNLVLGDKHFLNGGDRSSNQMGSGAGLVLTTPQNVDFEYALRFNFKASNNEAEYEALIAGLRIAKELEVERIQIYSDSQLVVNQVINEYQAKDPVMIAYLAKAKLLLSKFSSYVVTQIPRAQNERADRLARLASSIDSNIERNVPIEYLDEPSIKENPEMLQVNHMPSWMDPICNYLIKEELPDNPFEAKKLKYRATRYLMIDQHGT